MIKIKKNFLFKVIIFTVPIMLQRLLSTSIGLVDTIMVGRLGGIAGLAIASQIFLIMNNINYGLNNGISIFIAQYFGNKNYKMIKLLFLFQVFFSIINASVFFVLVTIFGKEAILFFTSDSNVINDALTYINIVKYSYFPICIINSFNVIYRSIQKPFTPLFIAFIMATSNIIGNYLFIADYHIRGIALSTISASYLGLLLFFVLSIWHKPCFFDKVEKTTIDKKIIKNIITTTFPILLNECLFGIGISIYTKSFAAIGTASLEGFKMASTLISFFFISTIGLNSAVSSFLGETLGKKDFKSTKIQIHYFEKMALFLSIILSISITIFSKSLLMLFQNNDPTILSIANKIVLISILRITMRLYISVYIGALRSGGNTKLVLFLDSGTMWLFGIPISLLYVYFFKFSSAPLLYLLIQFEVFIGLLLSYIFFKKAKWLNNITNKD